MSLDTNGNPLLEMTGLPPFSAIRPEHVSPAIEHLLSQGRENVARLLDQAAAPTWGNLMEPLEAIEHRINRVWSPVTHLQAVADNAPLREAYNACLPRLSAYHTELAQNERLYRACRRIAEGEEYGRLGVAERKIIDNTLRDFRLSGVDLPPEQRRRFKAISEELSSLKNRFQQNLLDATQSWKKHITDEARLEGLPDSTRALARQSAEREGLDGWVFTLDLPSYMPVMSYAGDRELRREVYEAYVTRASDHGPGGGRWDNTPVMEDILRLRHETARLVGFDNYAQYSLARKMARETDEVLDFLRDLALRSKPMAERELAAVQDHARTHGGPHPLEAWDVPYYSEQLRRHAYAFSQEDLRPYFPVPQVLAGMFEVVRRLFGLEVQACGDMDVWHPDVRYFEIRGPAGEPRGSFYLDLYARPHKRGGAWMGQCIGRIKTSCGVTQPVAFLSCNFAPPLGDDPSLLTHREVTTLFHEFGHGLHHMLTRIDYPSVAGISGVAWDAVELPSQFMENWCWEREALNLFAGHHRHGAPLPEELFMKMRAARNFQAGMQMVRQLEFALFDFRLYLEYDPAQGARIQSLLDEVREEVAVARPPEFNRFAHGFWHIFGSGYAAGYYSYKWAEVLSSDAFGRFEETGLFDRETSQRFLHTILEQGGSRDATDLFVEFRGRQPRIDALLRHSGVAP